MANGWHIQASGSVRIRRNFVIVDSESSLVPEAQVAGDSKIKRARGRRISESGRHGGIGRFGL
jgi:hypothetical protein